MYINFFHRPALQWLASFLFWGIVFGISYTQSPLYYSNQNQYFLHGLAQGGKGILDEDWLANTKDPTPVFSSLIAFTYGYLHEYVFHLYYIIIFAFYACAMVGTYSALQPADTPRWQRHLFAALFILVHSALLRWLSCQLFSWDYAWYFQTGLAGQYLLGSMFQPSVFGVLLVFSIYLFVIDKPYLSIIFACLGASIHSTYLLSAAMLTLSYMLVLFLEGQRKASMGVGLLALLLVAPVVTYVAISFQPTDPAVFAESQRILVDFRIPHHARWQRWLMPNQQLDWPAVSQIAGIVIAICLVWHHRLGKVMGITLAVAAILSVVQIATENTTLALLFPWRMSALLVPLAATIILTKLVMLFGRVFQSERSATVLNMTAAGLIIVCVSGGLIIMEYELGYRREEAEKNLMEFVQRHLQPGQRYVVPYRLPDRTKITRGPGSSDFLRKNVGQGLIPAGFQRFRLKTGAPIYVDFKSIPYLDAEVLEWRQRIKDGLSLYEYVENQEEEKLWHAMKQRGLTHIIVPTGQQLNSNRWQRIYPARGQEDRFYQLYERRNRGNSE